jgi:dipeptidyl aminopeptidase/acylaminoacyl peptidase
LGQWPQLPYRRQPTKSCFVGNDDLAKRPQLFVLRTPSSEPEPLELGAAGLDPTDVAFSPDGARLAVSMEQPGGAKDDIYLYDLATGDLTALVSGPASDSSPAWAANDRLLFTSDRDGSPQIWQIDTAIGSVPEQLTQGPAYHTEAVSRPTG